MAAREAPPTTGAVITTDLGICPHCERSDGSRALHDRRGHTHLGPLLLALRDQVARQARAQGSSSVSARTFWHSPIGRLVAWVIRKVDNLKSNHEEPFE